MHTALKAAGATLAAAFTVTAGLYAFSPRVTDREAGLRISQGELVDAHVETGVKMDAILPHIQYIRLPLFLQATPVSATEADNVTIRTRENARIYGTFEVHWALDNTDPNFGNIYTELQADDIHDLDPFIRNYTIPAAIDIYREVSTNSVSENLTTIGASIAGRLQQILDDRGYSYIDIKDVIPSGVGLSAAGDANLEQIVTEERKLDLLVIQGQVADLAEEITLRQSEVTIAALNALREGGVPEDQLLNAYYIQLMRDNDRIGVPFVSGPFSGTTGEYAVAVTPPPGLLPAPAAGPQPAPAP